MFADFLSWFMVIFGLAGAAVSLPAWLWWSKVTDRTLIGLTLVLSWLALTFSGLTALAANN